MSYVIMLTDNNRSRAYIQNLVRTGFVPKTAIVLGNNWDMKSKTELQIGKIPMIDEWFDCNESVYETLLKAEIDYKTIDTKNPNEETVVKSISEINEKSLIYSGPGGIILKEPILSQGVRFFHAHPGILPQYKGSTTFYYSMILQQKIGCSVIEMALKLDSGDVVYEYEFVIQSEPHDYDQVVDPLVRTHTLIEWLKSVDGKPTESKKRVQNSDGNTFYIIHPVLKHLAILKTQNIGNGGSGE